LHFQNFDCMHREGADRAPFFGQYLIANIPVFSSYGKFWENREIRDAHLFLSSSNQITIEPPSDPENQHPSKTQQTSYFYFLPIFQYFSKAAVSPLLIIIPRRFRPASHSPIFVYFLPNPKTLSLSSTILPPRTPPNHSIFTLTFPLHSPSRMRLRLHAKNV